MKRVKIGRKEAKESAYFLRIIYKENALEFEHEGKHLQDEAIQIKNIFSTIIEKSSRQTV